MTSPHVGHHARPFFKKPTGRSCEARRLVEAFNLVWPPHRPMTLISPCHRTPSNCSSLLGDRSLSDAQNCRRPLFVQLLSTASPLSQNLISHVDVAPTSQPKWSTVQASSLDGVREHPRRHVHISHAKHRDASDSPSHGASDQIPCEKE